MLGYYFRIAWRSLRRNPALSVLMVLAIGLGIGASMTTYAAFRAVGSDPIPWKSAQLFVPRIDAFGPKGRMSGDDEPPKALDYIDAMALMQAHAAQRQSALYPVEFSLIPDAAGQRAFPVDGHAVFSDFFAMVDAPFLYGTAWSAADDDNRAPTVVISRALNEKLFGEHSGVGKSLNLDGSSFRIIGVLDHWNPQPRYFDMVDSEAFGEPEDVFIPLNWAVDHHKSTSGSTVCNVDPPLGWDGWLHSTCVWMAMLVELPTAEAARRYRSLLDRYAREQQSQGRYGWPPNNRLLDVPDWLNHEHVVPDEVRVLMLIAFSFLAVCLVNVIGLMLAKFMRRSPEIGVRRALGATKGAIYVQFMTEAGIVGLAGGILGVALMAMGKLGLLALFDTNVAKLTRFDPWLTAMTLALALIVTVIAGLYPAARAAAVRPALQLKTD